MAQREPDTVLFLSMLYLPLLAAGVSFGVTQVYARMTLQRRWRQWLNNDYWITGSSTAAIISSIL
jgi:vitamin B12/bleomycin/antimicrobial peptide transport system ATP-binding/permease protein